MVFFVVFFFSLLNLFFSRSSKCVERAFFRRLVALSFSLSFLLTFFSLSRSLCPSLSLSPSPPSSLSLGDHTQRFLFPVGVMSLLHKQSALICQRSSRRFIKIQQAPTKTSVSPVLASHLYSQAKAHTKDLKLLKGGDTCVRGRHRCLLSMIATVKWVNVKWAFCCNQISAASLKFFLSAFF